MTDIVERLRANAELFRGSCEWPATANAFAEAADEIDRLRVALRESSLREGLREAEVERLRGLLRNE